MRIGLALRKSSLLPPSSRPLHLPEGDESEEEVGEGSGKRRGEKVMRREGPEREDGGCEVRGEEKGDDVEEGAEWE